jgi:hypothetical protein
VRIVRRRELQAESFEVRPGGEVCLNDDVAATCEGLGVRAQYSVFGRPVTSLDWSD